MFHEVYALILYMYTNVSVLTLGLYWLSFLFSVPPDPPHILDPNGRRMGSLIGPYDEGEPLSITCISAAQGNHECF